MSRLSVPRPPQSHTKSAFLLQLPLHSRLQRKKWRFERQNTEVKVRRRGLNPRRISLPSSSQLPSVKENLSACTSRLRRFLHRQLKPQPWGTRQSGIPAGDPPLARLPASGCPAVHLTFTHFIKHLLQDALLASPPSKNKHRSPQGRGINHQGWQEPRVPGSPLEAVARPHQVSSDTSGVGWATAVCRTFPRAWSTELASTRFIVQSLHRTGAVPIGSLA